jgi:hypothetical protein
MTIKTATVAAIAIGLCATGCGSSSHATQTTPRRSAQEPEMVTAAELAVRERVSQRLDAARERYASDAQVYPSGDATCKPFSDYQLDCTQKIRDETNPWTGVSSWRATVVPETGAVTIEEHGGRTLSAYLDRRSTCLAAGVNCG